MDNRYFDEFYNKYIIKGEIIAETGIHIGTGNSEIKPITLKNPVLKNISGEPFIPGSSMKGVMRSYLEKILKIPGFEKINNSVEICTADKSCLSKEEMDKNFGEKEEKEYKKQRELGHKYFADYLKKKTCDICQLFGSGDLSSKILVRDLKVIEDSFSGFEVRTGISIDRDINIAKDTSLFEIEIIPAGTRFELYLILDNLDKEEIEWKNILIVLNSFLNSEIDIGGIKSRGLGQIRLIKDTAHFKKIDINNIKNYLINPKSIKDRPLFDEIESKLLNEGEKLCLES
ncbi:MAG: CRISPR-associated RAMP protein Csx7 [Clostridiales bacterium]